MTRLVSQCVFFLTLGGLPSLLSCFLKLASLYLVVDRCIFPPRYSRAIAQCPTHPLSHLCLAVTSLALSMSRVVKKRHVMVQTALLSFHKYRNLRIQQAPENEAETWYNLGRAHQQLSLFDNAVRCYWNCLEKLEEAKRADRETVDEEELLTRSTSSSSSKKGATAAAKKKKTGSGGPSGEGGTKTSSTSALVVKRPASTNLLMRQQSADGTPNALPRADLECLQNITAYNLQLIYCHSGNYVMARKILEKYLVIV